MTFWDGVSWKLLASVPMKLGRNNISTRWKRPAPTDMMSVWELGGLLLVKFRNRFVLCVVIQTDVGQILFDIPSNLPLFGGSEGVHTSSLGRHVRGGHVERYASCALG